MPMMVDKEDLGLSLSLNFPPIIPKTNSSSSFGSPNWTDSSCFPSSSGWNNYDGFRVETRSFLKGIDVNRIPTTVAEAEEEAGISSPNSTISSISGKRNERDLAVDDHDAERDSSRGISDEDDGDNSRKKLRLSKEQSAVLEENFKEHSTLNPNQKLALAKRLGLRPRQVEVWFQNRRARTKLKQTEVDCEFLKRCCENLTDENKRLQKEIQELRTLNLSPQFYMQMAPPTTLTVCSSCERVVVPPSSSSGLTISTKSSFKRSNSHRTLPFNPCATMSTLVAHRPFDVLHRQS